MKFPYKTYGCSLRPVIPLRVKNGEKIVRYNALVDSGSDECLFDTKIAEILGIHLEHSPMRKAEGIAGQTVVYYRHIVEIEVDGRFYKTVVGFIDRASSIDYGIAGQQGFFDLFIVKFDLPKEEIELLERY